MTFEWDEVKNVSNKEKHGISFEQARNLWLDEKRIQVEINYLDEKRWALVAELNGKIWTTIYTMRGAAIRLISVRRARVREVKLYEGKEIS